ncbi:MAG: amidase [Ramlibacter sp.]|nr:amidase [Ramlibacter sp.]
MTSSNELPAALARIRQADVELKAFTALIDDDSAVAAAHKLTGPLAGRMVGVKDIFDSPEFESSYGSSIYAGYRPATEAAMLGIIRGAGGLVVGKTATTEFAFLQPADTLNPAAPGRTPGGSSAGSAAAVAAGLIPFAVGSQTGGSTVRPASYCGIAGFKPTFALLPTAGVKCFSWSLDTVGLFARTTREVSELAQAVSGGRIAGVSSPDAKGVTFGIPDSYPWGELSPSAKLAMDRAVTVLEAAGVRVVRVAMPAWVADAFKAHDAIQGWDAARALSVEYEQHGARLSPLLREYLRTAREVSDEAYANAQRVAHRARQQCAQWISGVDVLLTPSAPDEAPEGYASTGASTFNRAWTLLATPTLGVPGAIGVSGLPMGLQVIAPAGEDTKCLSAGLLLEELLKA